MNLEFSKKKWELSDSRGRSPRQGRYWPPWGGCTIWAAVSRSSWWVTRVIIIILYPSLILLFGKFFSAFDTSLVIKEQWAQGHFDKKARLEEEGGPLNSRPQSHQRESSQNQLKCNTRCYKRKYVFLERQTINIADWLQRKWTNLSRMDKPA